MNFSDEEIRRQMRLGEDSHWEFKEIGFAGNVPRSPRREDIADELAAFANTDGGVVLCGVTDSGDVQGMSREQMDALEQLLVEVCTDMIRPPIRPTILRKEMEEGSPFLLVEVPQGHTQHDSPGGSYHRVGSSKRRMTSDERLRLAQQRGQARFLWFDKQPVEGTGFGSLDESLWKPLLSTVGAADPEPALEKMGLLTNDENGTMRATSEAALFEAIVNAVVHRDYSIRGSRIRLSMFADCVEINSPGGLPNNLTIDSMDVRQSTRNEGLASIFGRIPVGEIQGSGDRQFFMERRGDGVPIILRETEALSGKSPEYQLIDDSDLVLTIPAAPTDATPATTAIKCHHHGLAIPGVKLLILFPNKTWKQTTTDENGMAQVNLHATHFPMTVFAAAKGYAAHLEHEWVPAQEALAIEMQSLPDGGAVIFPEANGRLPSLSGRLNPKRDTRDRTYLYASNIAIDEGKQQPVHFIPGDDLRLTDADGRELMVRIVEIVGRSALVEYRPYSKGDGK